jgi:hypothetical protein
MDGVAVDGEQYDESAIAGSGEEASELDMAHQQIQALKEINEMLLVKMDDAEYEIERLRGYAEEQAAIAQRAAAACEEARSEVSSSDGIVDPRDAKMVELAKRVRTGVYAMLLAAR